MRADLEKAYILHTRAYGDTSVIASCFTERYGRIPLIAKGVRNKKSKQRQYLQPFTPLIISWQGKSALKTLTHMETQGVPRQLMDKRLFSGFYLNELLMRLLPEHDDHSELFYAYADAIEGLYGDADLEVVLRRFEFLLLNELGYGLNFVSDAQGLPIKAEYHYGYHQEQGFVVSFGDDNRGRFSGAVLQSIAREEYDDPAVRLGAKHLTRQVLKSLLGNRPLQSRNLFKSMTPRRIES
ncbi:MAG: DNA repair protein RecO [Candidatus Pelagadaptatus aseana]|uniref:DNA repair protein RecO n=1 Tax=Candidatus Pelagadaptatus aseana TaxID=3120508 RepID=UPI0039B35BEE